MSENSAIKGVFETPYLQDTDLDFGLKNPDSNRDKMRKLLENNLLIIFQEEKFTLYREGDDSKGHIFLVDSEEDKIVYLIQYETENYSVLCNTVTQIALWRSLTVDYENITKKVFFEYLLNNFSSVVSDEAQTVQGKQFWIRHMSLAAANKNNSYTVGLIDEDKKLHMYDNGIEKFKYWLDRQDGWGEDLKYFNRRFFIMKKQ